MDLKGIVSVNGLPGLFKVISQMKNGVIAEALENKKRVPIYAHQQISALSDISMFTESGNKPISEIMKTIFEKENKGPSIPHKSEDKDIVAYFAAVVPDYDKEKVHLSNMRKLFSWYNLLQTTGNLKEQEPEQAQGDENKSPSTEDSHTKKYNTHPQGKTSIKTNTKGVKKAAGVRKTGTA